MANVLIATQPDDLHAIYIKLALEMQGHDVVMLYSGDFPTLQTHSFSLNNDSVKWVSSGIEGCVENKTFDTVWYRRGGRPILPDSLHPDDVNNAEREINTFYRSILHLVAKNAVWINPLKNRITAMHKLLQLQAAAEVGFKYPETLISNDAEKIRDFVKNAPRDGLIYKTFMPAAWLNKHDLWLTYTQKIAENDLPSDEVLQMVPGIFQHYIRKQYEIRVTYFNGYCVAVRLDSQTHNDTQLDWRRGTCDKLNVQRIELPESVINKCKLLMQKLGLIFGCLDIIFTTDGEYVFLEVNEQGQFLWIEEVNPEIKMMDMFARFVANIDSLGEIENKGGQMSMADLSASAVEYMKQAILFHKGTALLR